MAHPHRKISSYRPSTITPSKTGPFKSLKSKLTHKLRKVADLPSAEARKIHLFDDDDFDLLATAGHNIG